MSLDAGELVFLDAGIAIRYSDSDHNHLVDVLWEFMRYDGYAGGQLMAQVSDEQARRPSPSF